MCSSYREANQDRLPGLTLDASGTLLHSWQTRLLPFSQLDAQIRLDLPWNHPDQAKEFQRQILMYMNPLQGRTEVEGYAASGYAGNVHVFGLENPPPLQTMTAEIGAANLILAGEVGEGYRPWGDPLNLRDPAAGLNRSAASFGSPSLRPRTSFLMADGSVRTFTSDTDPEFLKLLSKPIR